MLKIIIRKMSTESVKIELRKTVAKTIEKLSEEEKKRQSNIVHQKLINSDVFKSSNRISIFLSTKDEINTEPIVKKIFEENKQCFVPRYSKSGMQMVKLHSMHDWETLPLTAWNIKQPLLKDIREDAIETGGLDLLICPGVAFTANGHRLGHGGGYYDAYLTKLKNIQSIPPKTVGVAFKEQVFSKIPCTEKDVILDTILFSD